MGLRREGGELLPEEEALLSPRAVEKRRADLRLGRTAARDALAELGMPPQAIGRAPTGEPLWPAGIAGAISHSGGLAAAVVSRDLSGLGLDLELAGADVSDGAARRVCSERELAWADNFGRCGRIMVFSAKEAIFKALYPGNHVWLDFADAELTWRDGVFEAVVLKPAERRLTIRSLQAGGYVCSATWV